jgi:hypothetical protein
MRDTTAYRPLAIAALAAAALTFLAACGESPVAPGAKPATAEPPDARTSLDVVVVPNCPAACAIQTVVATKRLSIFEGAIVLLSPGGSELKQLTSGAIDRYPAFSPDGARIAFLSTRDGGGLFVMKADGTAMVKIAAAPARRAG